VLDRVRAPLAALVAQLFFIAAGVYLGNQADQWKEDRDHRRTARATVDNFRAELRANAASIRERLPYHLALRDSLGAVLRRPVRTLPELQRRIQFRGSRSVDFAHTAYDLALTTQALSYLPRDLAFAVADVYLRQQAFEKLQDAYMAAVYQPSTFSDANTMPFAISLGVYMGDVTSQEPALLAAYARLLPRLDSAAARLPK
jgi:hypothetical protein